MSSNSGLIVKYSRRAAVFAVCFVMLFAQTGCLSALIEIMEESDAEEITTINAPELIIEPISKSEREASIQENKESLSLTEDRKEDGLIGKIRSNVGGIADFIDLCRTPSPIEQRRFASSRSLTVDEIADRINESAVDIFGDIILEDVGGAYGILEDYIDQL